MATELEIPYDEGLADWLATVGLDYLRTQRRISVTATDKRDRYNSCLRFAATWGLTLDNHGDHVTMGLPEGIVRMAILPPAPA